MTAIEFQRDARDPGHDQSLCPDSTAGAIGLASQTEQAEGPIQWD